MTDGTFEGIDNETTAVEPAPEPAAPAESPRDAMLREASDACAAARIGLDAALSDPTLAHNGYLLRAAAALSTAQAALETIRAEANPETVPAEVK